MIELINIDPSSFEEAVYQPIWVDSMVEEYESIKKNSAWEVVPRLEGKSMLGSKWIYKVKHATDGSIKKYKDSFVAKGFSQVEGVKYAETFSQVARYSSIRSFLALVVHMGWKIHRMDAKKSFLNGVVEEDTYIEQPEGFKTYD